MYLLYSGPSVITGEPIIAMLSGIERPSQNVKTGPMLQTWILNEDLDPTTAVKEAKNTAICGNCPLKQDICYVIPWQGPRAAYESYKKREYKTKNLKQLGRGHKIRLGSYGDPAAVPITVWKDLLQYAHGYTGYTHSPEIEPGLKYYVQASTESQEEATRLQSLGWKTFRIKTENTPVMPNEILCPSSKGVQCITCLKCDGKLANVAVNIHGTKHKLNKFKELTCD